MALDWGPRKVNEPKVDQIEKCKNNEVFQAILQHVYTFNLSKANLWHERAVWGHLDYLHWKAHYSELAWSIKILLLYVVRIG